MNFTKGSLILLSIVVAILIMTISAYSACFGLFGSGIDVPKFTKKSGIYIETDIKPSSRFEEAKIKSVSVLKFDAKYVKTIGGEVVDYVDLSNRFTDDLLKNFYKLGVIDVALGEYEDKIIETDTLQKQRGDLEVVGNTLQRSVEYKAAPYKKIETILGGKIKKYQLGDDWDHSFVEITLRLTDTYSGAVYWITDMRGYIKDIVETISQSISQSKYTEPIPTNVVPKTEEKPKTETVPNKETPKPDEKTKAGIQK